MRYVCCDERRARAVEEAGALNGIEYLEVSDSEAPSDDLRQRTLFVRLFQPPAGLGKDNVTITGGERIATVGVEWVAPATALPAGESPQLVAGLEDPATVLLVRTESRGDFSRYTLRLVAGAGSTEPAGGVRPAADRGRVLVQGRVPVGLRLPAGLRVPARARGLPGDRLPREGLLDLPGADARPAEPARPGRRRPHAGGRRRRPRGGARVRRRRALLPAGRGRDRGVPRHRPQADLAAPARPPGRLRRARGLERPRVGPGLRQRGERQPPAGHAAADDGEGIPPKFARDSREHREALAAGAQTFETVERAVLHEDHERFDFWTWGDAGCCLPKGATSATLRGVHPQLAPGDVLVFAEVAGRRHREHRRRGPARSGPPCG